MKGTSQHQTSYTAVITMLVAGGTRAVSRCQLFHIIKSKVVGLAFI